MSSAPDWFPCFAGLATARGRSLRLRWLRTRALALVPALMLACAAAQNFPFPKHVTYTAGTIKPALPQASLDNATATFYDAWKARYLVNGCQTNQYYVFYSLDYTPDPPD